MQADRALGQLFWTGIALSGIGVAMDNIAIGIGIGLALGVAIGSSQQKKVKKNSSVN